MSGTNSNIAPTSFHCTNNLFPRCLAFIYSIQSLSQCIRTHQSLMDFNGHWYHQIVICGGLDYSVNREMIRNSSACS